MQYKILSDKPIDVITIKKVWDCLYQGRGDIVITACFLKDFVEDFKSFDGTTVKLGETSRFMEVVNIA